LRPFPISCNLPAMKKPLFSGLSVKLAMSLLAVLLFPLTTLADRFDLNQTREIDVAGNILDIALSDDGKWAFVLTDQGEVEVLDPAGRTSQTLGVGKGYERLEFDGKSGRLWLGGERGKLKVISLSLRYDIETSGSPFRGPETAPVAIVVFTDYQ